jgi:hypothetical protein
MSQTVSDVMFHHVRDFFTLHVLGTMLRMIANDGLVCNVDTIKSQKKMIHVIMMKTLTVLSGVCC